MLLVKPKPWPDEAPGSILMRAAGLNGWQNVSRMLSSCCSSFGNITLSWRCPKRYQKYMQAFGIEVPTGAGAFHRHRTWAETRVKINERIDLPESIFRDEGIAICPDCIQTNQYLRRLWSVRLVATCAEHGCMLILDCPQCSSELHWNRPAPEMCLCGFDLRRSPRRQNDASAAKTIATVLQTGQQKQLDALCQMFTALDETCLPYALVDRDEMLTCIALQETAEIAAFLKNLVVAHAHLEHPRLTLLPFLRGSERLKEIALSVLEDFNEINLLEHPSKPIGGKLLINDCALVLGVEKTTLFFGMPGVTPIKEKFRKSKPRELKYSRASIDRLLRSLWRPLAEKSKASRQTISTERLPQLLDRLIAKPRLNAGYDMEKGLSSLREFQTKQVGITPDGANNLNTTKAEQGLEKCF